MGAMSCACVPNLVVEATEAASSSVPSNELAQCIKSGSGPVAPPPRVDAAPVRECKLPIITNTLISKKPNINQYTLGPRIGEGAWAKVYSATTPDSEEGAFAVKVYSRSHLRRVQTAYGNALRIIHREIENHSVIQASGRLSHHLVELVEVIDDSSSDRVYMVQRRVPGAIPPGPLHPSVVRRYFRDLVYALCFLHGRGVVHRDVKPDNVLLDHRLPLEGGCPSVPGSPLADGRLVLCDYSVSHSVREAECSTSGTAAFQSPEVFSSHQFHGCPVDCWALGVTLFVWCMGRLPFPASCHDVLRFKTEHVSPFYDETMHPLLRDLIGGLLTKDPERRLTLQDVLRHPWVTVCGMWPMEGQTVGSGVFVDAGLDLLESEASRTPRPCGTVSESCLRAYRSTTCFERRCRILADFVSMGVRPRRHSTSSIPRLVPGPVASLRFADSGMGAVLGQAAAHEWPSTLPLSTDRAETVDSIATEFHVPLNEGEILAVARSLRSQECPESVSNAAHALSTLLSEVPPAEITLGHRIVEEDADVEVRMASSADSIVTNSMMDGFAEQGVVVFSSVTDGHAAPIDSEWDQWESEDTPQSLTVPQSLPRTATEAVTLLDVSDDTFELTAGTSCTDTILSYSESPFCAPSSDVSLGAEVCGDLSVPRLPLRRFASAPALPTISPNDTQLSRLLNKLSNPTDSVAWDSIRDALVFTIAEQAAMCSYTTVPSAVLCEPSPLVSQRLEAAASILFRSDEMGPPPVALTVPSFDVPAGGTRAHARTFTLESPVPVSSNGPLPPTHITPTPSSDFYLMLPALKSAYEEGSLRTPFRKPLSFTDFSESGVDSFTVFSPSADGLLTEVNTPLLAKTDLVQAISVTLDGDVTLLDGSSPISSDRSSEQFVW